MELKKYFIAPYSVEALHSYVKSVPDDWTLTHKLDLYTLSYRSTDQSLSLEDRQNSFGELFHNIWYGWKLYRGAKRGLYWTAEECFDYLSRAGNLWGIRSDADLFTVSDEHKRSMLLNMLHGMRGIKQNVDYPWVAASKILHFHNPRLFPIYDIGYIWNVGLNGVFRSDYQSFCRQNTLKPGE